MATQAERITALESEVETLKKQVKNLFAGRTNGTAKAQNTDRQVTVNCVKCKGKETKPYSEAVGWRAHDVCPSTTA